MTKSNKPHPTREDLLAQLQALDNSTEIGRLCAEVDRLTAENSSLVSQRADLSREVTPLQKRMEEIREIVGGAERVALRRYGIANEADQQAAAAVNRLPMVHVLSGVAKGTHDPKTGLEFTLETKPLRDMTSGARAITKAELNQVFPDLGGPTVEVSEAEEDAALDAITAMVITQT